MIKNLRAFQIAYIPPTDIKGARISIKDLRHNKRKIIAYDYAVNTKETAINYLQSAGIPILYSFETEKFYFLLSDNFEKTI